MKFFIFVLCVTAAAASIFDGQVSYQSSYYLESAKERLARNLQTVCEDKSAEQIEEAITKLIDCSGTIEIESYTVCHVLQTEIPRCVRHVTDFMDECLPERSHGVPEMILQSFNSTVKFMCGTDGEHLLELVGNPCYLNRPSYRFNRCKNRIISKLQRYKDQTPTKDELCDAITSLKPCFLSHIQDSCGNEITRESFTALYEAAMKPCSRANEVEEIELVYRK